MKGRAVSCLFLLGILTAVILGGFAGRAHASDVVRSTLSNGLKVVIVRNELAPVATTMVNYLVGSNEAPDAASGRQKSMYSGQAHFITSRKGVE